MSKKLTKSMLLALAGAAFATTPVLADAPQDLTWAKEAVATLEDALRQDPSDVTVLLRMSAVLRELGREAEADEYFRRAAAIDPDFYMPEENLDGGCTPNTGPDIIVGDLLGMGYYGILDGFHAFAIGTTSCNNGSQNALWISSTNQHPVIAQNFHRIHNGMIQMIGQSWLKHGFTALTQNLCCTCNGAGGSVLGVGCSDPYTASLNGSQGNLGPKWEVNASNGVFAFPHAARNVTGNAIYKRLQVADADLNPANWPGAIYIAEGQYISQDDAQFLGIITPLGNGLNNASYRRFTYNYSPTSITGISYLQPTQRERPAVQAWADFVAGVQLNNADIPNEGGPGVVGRFIVGNRVVDNGNGTWTYQYAIQNLNSHAAGASFSVPVPGSTISNIRFTDVRYHSNDGQSNVTQDGTDWNATVANGVITWSTPRQNQPGGANSNALRWGTLYTFQFTANRAPVAATGTIGTWRTGSQPSVNVALRGPACLLAGDVNGDGRVDFTDLNNVLTGFGGQFGFNDLNNVLSEFGRNC